jgi:branched-chain amino acid aminotransferase
MAETPTQPTTSLDRGPPACRWVWLNGQVVAAADVAFPIWTNAAHYGTGVFEGIRAYPTPRGPAIFRVREHMERLVRSAQWYGLELKHSVDELSRAAVELVRREGHERTYIRPLVIFGDGPPQLAVKRSCPSEAIIMTRPLGAFLGEENYLRGIRITVSTWRRLHSATLPTTAKGTGHYVNSVIAAHEATDRGFDDALLLTVDGNVAECSGANIFFVKHGRVVTNDATSSILLGITRDSVLEMCRVRSIPTEIRAFTLSELAEADEVFITGTAAEVTPVREIEGTTFTTGEGTLSRTLQQHYRDIVEGRDPTFDRWLTYVRDPASHV